MTPLPHSGPVEQVVMMLEDCVFDPFLGSSAMVRTLNAELGVVSPKPVGYTSIDRYQMLMRGLAL